MKHCHIMPRNWFLIDGKPRCVTGVRSQYVYAMDSCDSPNSKKFDSNKVEPLKISEPFILGSNLRKCGDKEGIIYDSLRIKQTNIPLPFVLTFNYESDEPCEVEFPMGYKFRLRDIHRLQQLIHAFTGEAMIVKPNRLR